MSIGLQANDHSAEARRATLEQFAALPPDMQTAFLQKTFAQPELRADPELLHTAMKEVVQEHTHKLELEALLQLSPQLAPTGREQEMTQEAALAHFAASTTSVQEDVKRDLAAGKTVQQVKANAASNDTVTQAIVATTAQEHQEQKQREQVAANDEVHREKVGIAASQAHPFAHLVPEHLKAAIGAAMGGAQHGHDADVQMAAGGKAPQEVHSGRA